MTELHGSHEQGTPVQAAPPGSEGDRLLRRILWSIPTGLFVLGSRFGQQANLMTISWVCQVSTEPRRVGVGVERGALTHGLVEQSGVFAVSYVSREDRALVRRFVKAATEVELDEGGRGQIAGAPVRPTARGLPVLCAAPCYLECEVEVSMDLGSHTWFVGTVTDYGVSDSELGSLTTPMLRMEDTRMSYGG